MTNITAEEFTVTYLVNGARETVRTYGHGATYLTRKLDAARIALDMFDANYPDANLTHVITEPAGEYMYGAPDQTAKVALTQDDIITLITQATSDGHALDIMATVQRPMLLVIADQLYVDAEGHSSSWLRKAIVKEARS